MPCSTTSGAAMLGCCGGGGLGASLIEVRHATQFGAPFILSGPCNVAYRHSKLIYTLTVEQPPSPNPWIEETTIPLCPPFAGVIVTVNGPQPQVRRGDADPTKTTPTHQEGNLISADFSTLLGHWTIDQDTPVDISFLGELQATATQIPFPDSGGCIATLFCDTTIRGVCRTIFDGRKELQIDNFGNLHARVVRSRANLGAALPIAAVPLGCNLEDLSPVYNLTIIGPGVSILEPPPGGGPGGAYWTFL